jgi:hypothetical protein
MTLQRGWNNKSKLLIVSPYFSSLALGNIVLYELSSLNMVSIIPSFLLVVS